MWTDDWFYELDPSEKLMWVFLLTNPRNNIAGVYTASETWISTHTGFDKQVVEMILGRFERDGRIKRKGKWVALCNFHKHQSINPKVEMGVYRIISDLPLEIRELLPMDSLCIAYPTLLNLTLLNSTQPNGKEEVAGVDPKLISEVIKLFEAVDAKNKNYYNNVNQRAAAEFLISEYSFDDVQKRISFLPKSNKMPYFPTITTPCQLRDKWVQLEDAVIRLKAKSANQDAVAF